MDQKQGLVENPKVYDSSDLVKDTGVDEVVGSVDSIGLRDRTVLRYYENDLKAEEFVNLHESKPLKFTSAR